jgi:hypothetical protein
MRLWSLDLQAVKARSCVMIPLQLCLHVMNDVYSRGVPGKTLTGRSLKYSNEAVDISGY